MAYPRHHVGPNWPPDIAAYNYTLRLCWSDLAWEYLRRSPAYQRDYQLSRKGIMPPRTLKTGLRLTRIRRLTQRSLKWGLDPFCGSGAASAGGAGLLVDRRTYP